MTYIFICLAEERHKEPENDTDMGCQPVTPGWVECLTLQTTSLAHPGLGESFLTTFCTHFLSSCAFKVFKNGSVLLFSEAGALNLLCSLD